LAQDATITRGLVMGVEGTSGTSGFIRSADATNILDGQGFYMDAGGRMRFGEAVLPGNNYIYFNGTTLDVSGVLTATAGNIGGWSISSAGLKYLSTDNNKEINLNSNRGAFEVYSSGSLVVDINSNGRLTDLTSVASVWSPSAPFIPSGTIQGDGTPKYGTVSATTVTLTAGKTYEFSFGDGYRPSITVNGEWGQVSYGLLLSTNATPTINNYQYWFSGGMYFNTAGTKVAQKFSEVFIANVSATYYVRPVITMTSYYSFYNPSIQDWDYTPAPGSMDADYYFYGADISPSIEKTEIVGGGIQVVKDSTTYFKVDRNASGGVIAPFVTSVGSSVAFRGNISSSPQNDFTAENFATMLLEAGASYISMSDTYMGIYPSKGVRISPGAVTAVSGDGFIWMEPGPGAYAVIGNSTTNAAYRILVGSGGPSDARLKTEIEDVEDGSLEKIKELKLKYFRFKENGREGDASGNKKVGVIAQEVLNTSVDYLVNQSWPDNDGDYNVDHFSVLGHAIKAIQELSEKVDRLENEISSSKI
jgi:hypothetical protein